MGSLAIMLSTVAMLWNMIYNSGFDRLYAPGQKRGPGVRVLHALGFEGGFILIGLPIAAWMLDIQHPGGNGQTNQDKSTFKSQRM